MSDSAIDRRRPTVRPVGVSLSGLGTVVVVDVAAGPVAAAGFASLAVVASVLVSALHGLLTGTDDPERALERASLELPGNLRSAAVAPALDRHTTGGRPPVAARVSSCPAPPPR